MDQTKKRKRKKERRIDDEMINVDLNAKYIRHISLTICAVGQLVSFDL